MIRVDIMTDLETLGTHSNSTVFQVSAIAFNIETGNIIDEFNEIIDISTDDLICDGDTIKWWLNTNKKLMSDLLNDKNAIDADEAFGDFEWWIKKQGDKENVYLWGNGIKFDNVMIDVQMSKQDIEYPIYYKNDRDIRTLLELASMKSGLSEKELKDSIKNIGIEHNALDDCRYQIELAHKCYKILMR